MCRTCRDLGWRYCPTCEQPIPLAETSAPGYAGRFASVQCKSCNILRQREIRPARYRREGRIPRAVYRAQQREHQHPLLPKVIAHYRDHKTFDEIAAALGMTPGFVRSLIAHARRTGRWPKQLRRGKGWRKPHATP